MLVERVEELEPELEVDPLGEVRVLGDGEVDVLGVWATQAGDARAVTCIAIHSGCRRSSSSNLKRGLAFKGRCVEQRSFAGIEVIWILKEGIYSRYESNQAILSELGHD